MPDASDRVSADSPKGLGSAGPSGQLLAWYHKQRRDLPFRSTRDPYSIWVCEVMAQQTTLAAVVPYWQRFMAAFPDVASLARADLDQVLTLWSGLGYYRRARYLHKAAGLVVTEHGGRFPRSVEQIRSLPGIGTYTAAAIASICFGVAEPVIDGNVIRVLTRMARIGGDPARVAVRRRIESMARELIDPRRPGEFNQALMELGSLLCRPAAPSCQCCPVQKHCQSQIRGDTAKFPQTVKRRESVDVVTACVRVVDGQGRVLLSQRPDDEHNAGLWELPATGLDPVDSPSGSPAPGSAAIGSAAKETARRIERGIEKALGLEIRVGTRLQKVRHTITHHRIQCLVYEGTLRSTVTDTPTTRWFDLESLDAVALTGLTRKILSKIP